MDEVEVARKSLVRNGMKPYRLGRLGKKRVEFISYPWQAGQEIFILVREPFKPMTAQCVEADKVEVEAQ